MGTCNGIKCNKEKIKYASKTSETDLRKRLHQENPHLGHTREDILYHLGLDTVNHDLEKMFGDVKFVCMGGSQRRMEELAHYIMEEIGIELPTGTQLKDISQHAARYSMYKIGPVISVNHGMGTSSINILLNELIKLMYHAKCKDPIFIRIGTSGGIGLKPGTVVVSTGVIDGLGNDIKNINKTLPFQLNENALLQQY